ncbi:MAG: transporter [Acidobacteria bacterium]|nr:transporter [Acidobacteriota bacterium]
MKTTNWRGRITAAMLAAAVLGPQAAEAQVPARFYWKSLSGGNAVPFVYNSLSGNTNPFDPAHVVSADATFDATLILTGWAHTFTLAERSAMVAILVPMGNLSAGATVAGRGAAQSTSGFGDPMLEFNINLIGPKAQNAIPDVLRYEPGFSLDLLADLAIPIGEYDSSTSLNLGQNRWYGRIGLPMIWQLGAWVPGRRTTLEILPAVWLFGTNDDFVGRTLKTDPMFQLDAHLTRDFTANFWGGLDFTWYKGGGSTIDGVSAGKLDNVALGLTLGYALNDNLNMTVGYKSTVGDSGPTDVRMDGFMLTLVYGWHPMIEGMKRLKE